MILRLRYHLLPVATRCQSPKTGRYKCLFMLHAILYTCTMMVFSADQHRRHVREGVVDSASEAPATDDTQLRGPVQGSADSRRLVI